MQTYSRVLTTSEQMEVLGSDLANISPAGTVIFLSGDLGAGKTTLVRGFLRQLGYTGTVKSPTYTLIEPYHLNNRMIAHFDLYRLNSLEELESIGARDYFVPGQITCLIEWPEHGRGLLPLPDIHCTIEWQEPAARKAIMVAHTGRGEHILRQLKI